MVNYEAGIIKRIAKGLVPQKQDKSPLIKHSLKELYEDIVDRKAVDNYEKREHEHAVSFVSADDALKMVHTPEYIE